jgi:hypothetical protein
LICNEDGGAKFSDKILEFDITKERSESQNGVLQLVKIYLNSANYAKLPAPLLRESRIPNVVNVSEANCIVHTTVKKYYAVKSEEDFQRF